MAGGWPLPGPRRVVGVDSHFFAGARFTSATNPSASRAVLLSLAFPKADATDPGIEPTRQVIAKANQADIASHDLPELALPIISVTDEIAEGPVMILYLWPQFDCES